MAQMRCKSCGGEYSDTLKDGSRYAHACPPIILVSVERDGRPARVSLGELRPTDVIAVTRAGEPAKALAGAMLPDDIRVGDTFVERENKRDENPKIVDYDRDGNPVTANLRDGAGADRL